MTDSAEPAAREAAAGPDVPARNVASRASDLLPEELAVGSADPKTQAAVILQESEERTEDPTAGL